MANITVSANTTVVNVDSTTNNVSVSSTLSNIVVGEARFVANSTIREALSVTDTGGDGSLSYSNVSGVFTYTGPSATEVRAHLGNTLPITYDSATGVIGFDQNLDDLTLKKYQETVVANGTASGNVSVNITNGTVHQIDLGGDITGITLTNISTGGSATIFFTQDGIGGAVLDTTTHPSNWTDWKFTNGFTDFSTGANEWNAINVFYDGTDHYATLITESGASVQNSDLANSNVTFNGVTVELGSSGTITDFASNVLIDANANITQSATIGQSATVGNALTVTGLTTSGSLSTGLTTLSKLTFSTSSAIIDGITNGSASSNINLDTNQVTVGRPLYTAGVLSESNIVSPGPMSLRGGESINLNNETEFLKIQSNIPDGVTPYIRSYAGFTGSGNANVYIDPLGSQTTDGGFRVLNNSNTTIFHVNTSGNVTAEGNIETNSHLITNSISPLTGNVVTVFGNMEVNGNLNVVEKVDLLVQDNSITLNYGNASARDAQIIVDRSGSTLTNVDIKWNETTDRWTFTNDGSTYYNLPTSTSDLAEGTNLYYTDARFDTRLATKSTSDLAEGTNLYYTTARQNTDFDTRLGTKSTSDLAEGTNLYYTDARADARVNLQTGTNLDLSSKDTDDLSQGTTNLYYSQSRTRADVDGETASATPNASGTLVYDNTTGMFTYTPSDVAGLAKAALSVTTATPSGDGALAYDSGTGVFTFTPATVYGNVEVADFLANGFGSNTITTTGNITGGYIIAGNDVAEEGIFIGDINGAVQQEVRNETGVTIARGKAVYLTGGNTGSEPHVALADNSNASQMPVIGIVKNNIPDTELGEIVTSGKLNIGAHNFTQGADLFVNGTGDLQETAPTGEGNLIQKIGKVVNSTTIIVQGAFRTNATPNLDEGNIFLGSSSNTTIAVTPDSNFETTGNAFGLSNALTDVNSITTESSSGFAINSGDGTTVTSKFGVNSTVTETANIAGKGFGVFNFTDGTNTSISYSGTDSFEWYEIDGNVTVGSTTMTISSVVRGIDSTTAAVSDIIVGQVIANGTSASTPGSTDLIIFPDDAYVVSVDSGAGTVEMSKPAVQTTSFTHTTDGIILDAGLVDTTTGQVIKLLSQLRALGGGSDSALLFRSIRNTPFGYPASGPVPTDFDIITAGTASDYSMSLSTFMLGQTPITNDTTVLNAPLGITIGENTQLTNRGENDSLSSFGMNMMWDGLTSYGRPIQPQVLFKSYTDNTEQGEVGSIGGAGPRLFFTSANGNSNDNAFDTYPRANQELGRLSFWGTTGEQLTPSSYSVPSYMSVQAADNWDTWGGGVAGNTNVFMASTASGQAQTYLAFKSGELYLTGSNSNPVTFAPAQSVSGFRPELAYDGSTTTWANINYANTGTSAGAKFTVTNGDSVDAGVVGDMQMSLKRNDNSSNLVTPVRSILSGSASGALEGGKIVFTFDDDGSIGSTLNGLAATVSAPSTIDETTYGSPPPPYGNGNESALGNNVYDLSFAFTDNSVAFYYILSGGSRVSYTDIGGTDPYYFVTQTSGMTVTTVVSSGVTAKEWKFNLEEQSNNLALQSETVTKVEFSDDASIFSNRVRFQNLDTTAINALTGMSAGDTVYNTTEATLCFYDGSAWQKVDKTAL